MASNTVTRSLDREAEFAIQPVGVMAHRMPDDTIDARRQTAGRHHQLRPVNLDRRAADIAPVAIKQKRAAEGRLQSLGKMQGDMRR